MRSILLALLLMVAGKGHDAVLVHALYLQRYIVSKIEERLQFASLVQRFVQQVQFHFAFVRTLEQLPVQVFAAGLLLLCLQLLQILPAQVLVYGASVVRVHQAQVPQLGALVYIGHAGAGDFKQRLAQGI